MDDSTPPGDVFDALTHPYRRQLLLALLNDESHVDPLKVLLSPGDVADRIETELVHSHLPKLADRGFIRWDRQAHAIRRGPNWDDIEPLLQLLSEHQDELPDGWLDFD